MIKQLLAKRKKKKMDKELETLIAEFYSKLKAFEQDNRVFVELFRFQTSDGLKAEVTKQFS